MGELAKFYGLASVAFVGGSLVPKGGHDILQPLFHQVPTLFGPYMHNQRALASLCRDAGAAREVAGAEELGKAVVALLDDTAERRSVLLAAERLLAENRGASTRCAAIVAELVEGRSGCSRQSARVGREPGTGNRAPDPGLPWRP